MIDYPNNADGDALRRIASDGVDMSLPRIIEFHVDVPNESAAKNVAKALSDNGYEIKIFYDEGELEDDEPLDEDEFGSSWTVYAKVMMAPDYEKIIKIQAEIDRIVQPIDGKSDGWGTLVK